jgi:hypothetical protein
MAFDVDFAPSVVQQATVLRAVGKKIALCRVLPAIE